jgi:glutathione S-transferase
MSSMAEANSAVPLTVTYFDFQAAPGEKLRLCCVLGNIPFNDNRVKRSEWADLKPLTPQGVLPILVEEGLPVKCQSEAILKYLGRKGGLYPTDGETYHIDAVLDLISDLDKAWSYPLYMGMRPQKFGYPEGSHQTEEGRQRTKALREQFVDTELKRFAGLFTKQLKDSGGMFICGSKPTIADARLLPTLRSFQKGHIDFVPVTCLDGFPELIGYIKYMMNLPAVKEWYAPPVVEFTKEELLNFRGVDGAPMYICAKGTVFDVTNVDFYAPGNSYNIFVGHDGTFLVFSDKLLGPFSSLTNKSLPLTLSFP